MLKHNIIPDKMVLQTSHICDLLSGKVDPYRILTDGSGIRWVTLERECWAKENNTEKSSQNLRPHVLDRPGERLKDTPHRHGGKLCAVAVRVAGCTKCLIVN